MLLKLLSLLGLVVFIFLAWAISTDRKRFPWRTVLSGLAMQFLLAWVVLKTDLGLAIFGFANDAVDKLLSFSDQGASMVFGPLANGPLLAEKWGPANSFVFAVTITATIILVSALSSLLYHYNILQRVVRGMSWVMEKLMKTSGSESLAAAANIFMGQTEAPLVIKPYIARMTQSELLAIMVPGMASIAGGVLAAYVKFGIPAGHLITASVMSAPAALLISKIMLPETEQSETAKGATAKLEIESVNGIDAVCRGATEGMALSINVMAMLIAFVAVVGLLNYLIELPQTAIFHVNNPVTLQTMFGWINAPFAWLMGIPAKDCLAVGQVLGERVALNEFLAYLSLKKVEGTIDPRSFTIATYALCGFANFGSVAIQIAGIGSMAPNRRSDLARLGLRAMVGGLLACYMMATIVGMLID